MAFDVFDNYDIVDYISLILTIIIKANNKSAIIRSSPALLI